jgi:N-carbamoylputrescine amidase
MRAALVQHADSGTLQKSIEKTCVAVQKAASSGCELVVLQELHQSHYFCIEQETKNFHLAENFQSDCHFWGSVAKEHGVVLVTSLFEKAMDGLYFNTAVVFDKDGSMCGKYRKMHIPQDPGFNEKFYFTPGDLGFEPISTSVGKLGVLICWDQWFPEAARIMALKGAEILIYPTAIGWFDEESEEEKHRQLESWMAVQRGHAVANGLPTVAVNRVGFEKDPSGFLNGIRFWGNSFVYGAQGELLARASSDQEEIITVDLDMKRSKEVRDIWPFLRDRRIDAFGALIKRLV